MAPSSRYLVLATGLGVALLCGIVSVISLAAAFIALPAGDTLEQIRRGESVPAEAARKAVSASLRAGDVFDAGRHMSNAALAIGRLPAAERKRGIGGTSEAQIVDRALMAEPTSPHNWARRAKVQLAAGDLPGARKSLETSLLMGRFVPGLTVPRLSIILELLRRGQDPVLEGYFAEQVRVAARSEPHELAAFANKGAAEGLTQRFLATDYVLYNAYLRALIGFRAGRDPYRQDPAE